MCGIASVINTRGENYEVAKKIFKSILLANESRGKDSTGVLSINLKGEEFSLFKDTIPASKFLRHKKFRQTNGDIWIGHTRLATLGEVNIRNAHPLRRGDIFLVHNGVISNHSDIGKSLEYEYQVDSEVLIPIVKNNDWDLLQDIKGSANFIAWDKSKNLIYIERHDNPLYCLSLKEMGLIMFSSVEGVLEFIAGHYGDKEEPFEFENDTLVVLDMKGNVVNEKIKLSFEAEKTSYQLTNPSVSDERYPYYTDDDGYYGGTRRYDNGFPDDDGKEMFCEACGSEVSDDEAEFGMNEWGVPLCYTCLTELYEVEKTVETGGKVDKKDKNLLKFKHIIPNGYLT